MNDLQPEAVSVTFNGLTVTDEDFAALMRIRRDLVSVDFFRCDISDVHISRIEQLTYLHDLGLGGTKITAAGLKRLETSLPNCAIHIDRIRLISTRK